MTAHQEVRYVATGPVANDRISPLLPNDWKDLSKDQAPLTTPPDFLWENGPRHETKEFRDNVKVYSHLPNGTDFLDSKWVLGRIFATIDKENEDPLLATLETHCFRGLDGFQSFAHKVNLCQSMADSATNGAGEEDLTGRYPDIMRGTMDLSNAPVPNSPSSLWVVKDAMANGAGGIWVVSSETYDKFSNSSTSPLYPEHRYVAQRYVWPPVLFDGRKCHVRLYALLTSDGRAFIHHRAFLHVANDKFTTQDACKTGAFQDSIHITNCCANSHDNTKFAGEILADLEQTEYTKRDGQSVVPLGAFYPSIRACISALAKRSFPFLQGGHANHGFEYMGIDFMLSYNAKKQPLAYMLEINAPPSQDTATGLDHAENLHNDVIRDLTTLWVIPHVQSSIDSIPGGWRCVYTDEATAMASNKGELIVPSKAAIINKIRWALFEKKAIKREQEETVTDKSNATHEQEQHGTQQKFQCDVIQGNDVAIFARQQFPFYSHTCHAPKRVFFENAGGSQVPIQVIHAMADSLKYRHRTLVGANSVLGARKSLRTILGAAEDDAVFLGPNATSLLSDLAQLYVKDGLLTENDEIIVSTENHMANFEPWIKAAKLTGARLKLFSPFGTRSSSTMEASSNLEDLVTPKTRILAIPHASNVLGQIRDIKAISEVVKTMSNGNAHVVVDGVAAVPHFFADFKDNGADWYVVSCHKVFGPHVGALCGNRNVIRRFTVAHTTSSTMVPSFATEKLLEHGTINYEGCAGIMGLDRYFAALSTFTPGSFLQPPSLHSSEDNVETFMPTGHYPLETDSGPFATSSNVKEAYRRIQAAERPLVEALLQGLQQSENIVILENKGTRMLSMLRLPTVSFVHDKLSSDSIVSFCARNGISCRCSSFLCTTYLAEDFRFDHNVGVVRVSLAHYNTLSEVDALLTTLRSIPNW